MSGKEGSGIKRQCPRYLSSWTQEKLPSQARWPSSQVSETYGLRSSDSPHGTWLSVRLLIFTIQLKQEDSDEVP